MFGKTATEVMWITDAVNNEFYKTRAESHGCIYISTMRISPAGAGCTLTMTFDGRPQSLMAKMFSVIMGLFFKSALKKVCGEDLNDIKKVAESRRSD
jgi:hypothetical protein